MNVCRRVVVCSNRLSEGSEGSVVWNESSRFRRRDSQGIPVGDSRDSLGGQARDG